MLELIRGIEVSIINAKALNAQIVETYQDFNNRPSA